MSLVALRRFAPAWRRAKGPALVLGAGAGAAALFLRGSEEEYNAIPEEVFPKTYEPERIAAVWREHPRVALSRMCTIASVALPFGAKIASDLLLHADEPTEAADQRMRDRAVELRGLLVWLGPTFIKFGQMLSIRPDVMPPPVVYELQRLCDAVPSYPTEQALELIEAELGAPASVHFDGLSPSTLPVAAASLGQVYRCRLRASGEEVALKVQRPDMIRAVSLDLYLMRLYCACVEWFKVRVLTGVLGAADRSPFDVGLLDTFARASYLELDYVSEAANMRRFQRELLPKMAPGTVYVPKVHGRLTSRKVLVSEWIQGERLVDSKPEIIGKLTAVGIRCFLAQLLDVGFFHSDPHPGNLLVDGRGRLVLIDFGLCAQIASFDSRQLTSALVHLMRGDVDGLLDDAITLRFLPAEVDREALLPPLRCNHICNHICNRIRWTERRCCHR